MLVGSLCVSHSSDAAAGLQEGLMNMSKGEKAVLSSPREYACGGTLIPAPPDDADRVEFELQLLGLTQVWVFAAEHFPSSLW